MSVEQSFSSGTSPSRDRVLEEVREIVADEMEMALETIREGHALEADLGCDSLGKVEILMEVEEHFGIATTDKVEEKIRTVGDIADGVLELLDVVRTRSGRG
jgi:acyl carrier protein